MQCHGRWKFYHPGQHPVGWEPGSAISGSRALKMNSTSSAFCRREYALSPIFVACCRRALVVVKPPFALNR